jgi:hypothetical protein
MNYLAGLAQQASQGMGSPPSPQARNIGAPGFVPQPHVAPPPYTVAKDPGWAGIVDPGDHELINILDKMEPEERQVFQQRIQAIMGKLKPMLQGGGAAPPPMPPAMPGGSTPIGQGIV